MGIAPAGPPVAKDSATVEKVMSKEQTATLFDSVDSITRFASNDTGLPQASKVKRKVLSRAEVTRYLMKNFAEDESAKRLQRSEIVLKKFGLLDRDFDLKPFLIGLLTEQVAGFYDVKTKYVNLLNWVEPDDQKPVLAHELTHALQDQKVGLEKWSSAGFAGVSKTAAEDSERVQVDELETARQAVTEGQAMVVFVDYSIKDSGHTLKDSPDIGLRIRESAADANSSPMMARAPLLLQRALLFPYSDGFGFEQAVLIAGGKEAAFTGVLARPPGSSFEIMNPAAYLKHTPVPVLRLPDMHASLGGEYEPYDVGVMGELDVEIMARKFSGSQMGAALATEWDGGVYYAAQRKSASAAERATTASLALVYFSRWKSAQAAQSFLRTYTAQLARKYAKLKERKSDELEDEQLFTTEEGDVYLSAVDSTVFVSEGLPAAKAREVGVAFRSAQGRGPVKLALAPRAGQELSLGLAGTLAGFGVINPQTIKRYTSEAGR